MDNYGADRSGDGNNSHRGIGRGRGRGTSWNSGKQEPNSLRRPVISGPTLPTTAVSPAPATENKPVNAEMVKNSKLSAFAAEFVPQKFSPATVSQTQQGWTRPPSVQDRLQMARQGHIPGGGQRHQGSQGMPMAFVVPQHPHGQQMYQQYGEMPQQQGYNQYHGGQDYGYYDGGSGDYVEKHQSTRREVNNHSSDYEGTLRHLDHVIKTLTTNPGRFDSLVNRIVNSVKPYLDQPSQSQDIATMIIQQSINETNFRYSGARLCTSLVGATSTSVFKDTLLTRCQEQTELLSSTWQESNKHSDDEEKRCNGLLLFLAELVMQMEPAIVVVLGMLLVQLITAILQSPASNSAKNICQALKLAGKALESDGSSKEDMEQVMQQLTKLVTEGQVDSHVGRMVQGVNNLRNENWGNSVKTESETNSNSAIQQSDEPVFYGPDGNVLSAEESKFLQDIAEANPEVEEYVELENEADKWEDEEEEIMVAAAFEEFLNLSNNTKR